MRFFTYFSTHHLSLLPSLSLAFDYRFDIISAKFRPRVSSIVLTPSLVVARQTQGLLLGMHSILVDSLDKSDEIIQEVRYVYSRGLPRHPRLFEGNH